MPLSHSQQYQPENTCCIKTTITDNKPPCHSHAYFTNWTRPWLVGLYQQGLAWTSINASLKLPSPFKQKNLAVEPTRHRPASVCLPVVHATSQPLLPPLSTLPRPLSTISIRHPSSPSNPSQLANPPPSNEAWPPPWMVAAQFAAVGTRISGMGQLAPPDDSARGAIASPTAPGRFVCVHPPYRRPAGGLDDSHTSQ